MTVRLDVILILAGYFASVHLEKPNSALHNAIRQILNGDFATHNRKIDIVLCGGGHGSGAEISNKLMQSKKILTYRISNCGDGKILLNTSTLLTFDSPKSFRETANRIVWQTNLEKRYKHLVYIAKGQIKDITESIIDGFDIDKVAFLVNESEKSIDLATSFMFTEKKCRENQVSVINRFNKEAMSWESGNFYPNKYKNLYLCEVSLVRAEDKRTTSFTIFNHLLMMINFTGNVVYPSNGAELNQMLNSQRFDFYEMMLPTQNDPRLHNILLNTEVVFFVIPFGQPLTTLERFLSPFDSTTWLLILTTIAATFIAIQVSGFFSQQLQRMIFGNKIGSPSMNFLNIFLCGGQTKTPSGINARFIFLTVLVWSLIIRTCFQSLMYRAVQMDLRHSATETLQDLRDNHFEQFVGDREMEKLNSGPELKELFHK